MPPESIVNPVTTTPETPPQATSETTPSTPTTTITPATALTSESPTSSPSWLDSLPDDLKSNERLKGFGSIEDLAKAVASQSEAKPVPEATAYKLPKDFPIKEMGVWANKLGLTQEQLDGIIQLDAGRQKHMTEQSEKALTSQLNQLLDSWGPEKDANIKNAALVVKQFDEDGSMKDLLNQTGAGNHPVVVKYFAKLGKALMAEGGFIKGQNSSQTVQKTSANAIFDNR